jgi:CP family cyanate transporter-like MFS transporter
VTEARATPRSARTDRPGGRRVPGWLLVVMVGVIGLNLRAALGAVPPLLGPISTELGIPGSTQGLLTSLGVVFMGLCAPVGQRVAARFGSEATTAAFLGVLAVGGLLRLAATTTTVLLLSAAVSGAAMGAISALVPGLIAHHIPRVKGLATGIYSTGLALGVAIAAWVAVPTAELLHGWRPSLALWGGVALLTMLVWLVLVPRLRRHVIHPEPDEAAASHRLPWRSPTAWWVTTFSAVQMIVGFSGLAWITPYYAALGMPVADAARLFAFFQIIQLAAMLTLPTITDFTRDRRPLLAVTVVATAAGVLTMVVAPMPLALLAIGLFGFGVGGGSALVLVLVSDYTSTQQQAARLGAMTLMVAFLAGALGPVVLGGLHDVTGSLVAGYAVMVALSVGLAFTLPAFRPGRTID